MGDFCEDPEISAKLLAMGLRSHGSTPEAFAAHLKDETARWHGIFKAAGLVAK